jgi:hypothetical protein
MAVKRKPASRAGKPPEPVIPENAVTPAPVEAAPPSKPGHRDKRDSERIQILGEFHGEVMVFQPITVKEISVGGAQVETHFPLQLDSLHDFRLTLGGQSVVIKARVAHCSISDVDQEMVAYRSGIEFVDPPERIHSVIAEFIDAIMGGRRAP